MWPEDDFPYLDTLDPADQLWIIAQAIEKNGGPAVYVETLRTLAERLEDLGSWLGGDGDRRCHGTARDGCRYR